MSEYLLDTSILIRYLRKAPGYRELFLDKSFGGEMYISAITRLEVVRGMREHERKDTFGLLDSLFTLPVDSAVSDLAGEQILSWRSRGITLGIADSIIAATAISQEVALITTNARHFPMPELTVWQADEAGQLKLWERE
ncbi:MAG: type II toxin-antitoxin system VapC family toxin [Anaerolineales bacterium]|nr:type II toxin-antitoxin system VapC family toxin [Anaerolineales bacterium]